MDEPERSFYEIEAIAKNWGIRKLKRQHDSSLYERLALSKDKQRVKELSRKGQLLETPSDLIKQPYILEFLGFKEEAAYTETDLERAIIDKISLRSKYAFLIFQFGILKNILNPNAVTLISIHIIKRASFKITNCDIKEWPWTTLHYKAKKYFLTYVLFFYICLIVPQIITTLISNKSD